MVIEEITIENFYTPQYLRLISYLYLLDTTTFIPNKNAGGPPLVQERINIMESIATGGFDYAVVTSSVWMEIERVSMERGFDKYFNDWLHRMSNEESGSTFRIINLNVERYRNNYPQIWKELGYLVRSGEFSLFIAALETGINKIVTDDKEFHRLKDRLNREFGPIWKHGLEILDSLQFYKVLNPKVVSHRYYRPRRLRV